MRGQQQSRQRLIRLCVSKDSVKKAYLFVDDGAKACLALDDGVRDAHLAAESRKEDDELDGVDVVCDDDERGFLGLDESDDVVETVFDEKWFFGVLKMYRQYESGTDGTEPRTSFAAPLPPAAASAVVCNRAFFSCLVSGRYLLRSLKSCVAVFLSSVWLNCAIAGGTLRRWLRMTF